MNPKLLAIKSKYQPAMAGDTNATPLANQTVQLETQVPANYKDIVSFRGNAFAKLLDKLGLSQKAPPPDTNVPPPQNNSGTDAISPKLQQKYEEVTKLATKPQQTAQPKMGDRLRDIKQKHLQTAETDKSDFLYRQALEKEIIKENTMEAAMLKKQIRQQPQAVEEFILRQPAAEATKKQNIINEAEQFVKENAIKKGIVQYVK